MIVNVLPSGAAEHDERLTFPRAKRSTSPLTGGAPAIVGSSAGHPHGTAQNEARSTTSPPGKPVQSSVQSNSGFLLLLRSHRSIDVLHHEAACAWTQHQCQYQHQNLCANVTISLLQTFHCNCIRRDTHSLILCPLHSREGAQHNSKPRLKSQTVWP